MSETIYKYVCFFMAATAVVFALHAHSVQAQTVPPLPSSKPEFMKVHEAQTMSKLAFDIPVPVLKPTIETVSAVIPQPASQTLSSMIDAQESKASSLVVTDRQVRLMHEIFDLQDQGRIVEADIKISQLTNKLLMGHILAQRYLHPTAYQSSYEELTVWLNNYADLPEAFDVYELAVSKPAHTSQKIIKQPIKYRNISGNLSAQLQSGKIYRSTTKRSSGEQDRVQKLYKEIKSNVNRQQVTLALNVLNNDYAVQFIDDVEYDELRAIISSGYLYAGKLDQALQLATTSLSRSGSKVPLAAWVKGLVEWQRQNYAQAATAFEVCASSEYASGWLVSAAAYWASRAHLRQGDSDKVTQNLALAAAYPRTFYGLIAVRALGNKSHFNWVVPELTRSDTKLIEGTEQGKRAALLIKAGQPALAELELKTLNVKRNIELQRSLLAYANYYNLPSLMMIIANAYSSTRGNFYDAALYPLLSNDNQGKKIVDEALLNAFIRQESRFDQYASNASGATGLMQLMPATAVYISGDETFNKKEGRYLLKNPEVNLALGEKYINELLNHEMVQKDLMALAIAYNAGPGNLSKWKAEKQDIADPLLFIEMIPLNETRAFVERVMANYWIYKMRLQQETPSLDAVAEGRWALYIASLNSPQVASN